MGKLVSVYNGFSSVPNDLAASVVSSRSGSHNCINIVVNFKGVGIDRNARTINSDDLINVESECVRSNLRNPYVDICSRYYRKDHADVAVSIKYVLLSTVNPYCVVSGR